MSGTLRLAWRYLAHHKIRTGVLIACIALVFFLPLAVSMLVTHYEDVLIRRARSVPLVAGAKGSRYDLVLGALYFRGLVREKVPMREIESLGADGLSLPVPLLVEDSAAGAPLVGTTLDYFDRMALRIARGHRPRLLGDVVLGADVAERLGLGPGDRLLTDTRKLYDLASTYPLRMRVTGVLAPARSPDDGAVFVDIRTAWIVQGIGHGHQDVAQEVDPNALIERRDDEVVVGEALPHYAEITPENIESYHFHGDISGFPLTGALVWPTTPKSSTLLKGRYSVSPSAQLLVPTEVVHELLGFVFRMKRFFDANALLVGISTLLFLGLIVVLTLRIRKREIETLFRIGCSRGTVFRIQALELGTVLAVGLTLAVGLSLATKAWIVHAQSIF